MLSVFGIYKNLKSTYKQTKPKSKSRLKSLTNSFTVNTTNIKDIKIYILLFILYTIKNLKCFL